MISDNEGSRPVPDPTLLTTSQLDREIAHLKELNNLHFELIERQRVESKRDNDIALSAALDARKDAISSLSNTYETGHSMLISQLDELKMRVTAVESVKVGGAQTWSYIVAALGLAMVMFTVILQIT